MPNKKLLLVGCGKMGGALLAGITSSGWPKKNILVIEPSQTNKSKNGVKCISAFDSKIVSKFAPDIILLAIKPQAAAAILPDYKSFAPGCLFISILAGKTTKFFAKHLGRDAAIIRTMPNLPAIIGKGVTIIFSNDNVSTAQENLAIKLFSAVGECYIQEDESLLDAVTAISGSGPAYLFHFIECLAAAGKKLGLPDGMAMELALSTISGASELAAQAITEGKTVAGLREAVTSPKGTTEAALGVLMGASALQKLVSKAAEAACKRSEELSE